MYNRFKYRLWHSKMGMVNTFAEKYCAFDDGINVVTLDCDLLQCSTLRDKHGVEIYEGDICEDSAGHRYIIGFTPLEGFYRAPMEEQHHHCTLHNHRDLTVAGNVYEGEANETRID